jgi:hypothetical protein
MSTKYAVVHEFNKHFKCYQRKGLLVEKEALEKAKHSCSIDKELRKERRQKDQKRREIMEQNYIKQFALKIRELFPYCPENEEYEIADHACQKYSRRIGRSKWAKNLDEYAIELAVQAHVRHNYTDYDKYMLRLEKYEARSLVSEEIDQVLDYWSSKPEDRTGRNSKFVPRKRTYDDDDWEYFRLATKDCVYYQ